MIQGQRTFAGNQFRIDVSADGLAATIVGDAGVIIPAGEVIALLKEVGISFDDGTLIETLQERDNSNALSFVLARGTPPINGQGGEATFCLPVSEAIHGVVAHVPAGHLIAMVSPSIAGTDGLDVFSQVIRHRQPGCKPGVGTLLRRDGIYSTVPGNVRIKNGTVTVQPLIEIHAGDNPPAAPLNFQGDIFVKGSLPADRGLQTTGCLIVGGAIDGASFKVGEWVNAKGAIIGRDKGEGVIGGDLRCRYISGVTLSVGGDVHVQTEIVHSRVACTGRLSIPNAPIIGGSVTANGGITCRALGCFAGTPTLVTAGIDETLRLQLVATKAGIDKNRATAANIRAKLAPMMQHIKSLNSQSKEKVTELLFEADELEASAASKLAELRQPCRDALEKSRPEIVFGERIYPGVTIRFPGIETVVDAAIEGPARIFPRKSNGRMEIAIEKSDGEIHALASVACEDHFTPCVMKLSDAANRKLTPILRQAA